MKKIVKFTALVATLGLFAVSCGNSEKVPTNKKEVMDAFVAGTLKGYAPAAFFVHFPGDTKVGQGAIDAHLDYWREVGADIVKVQFEQAQAPIADLDQQQTWDNICPLPVDFYRPTLEVVKGIHDQVGDEVYVLPTIYSPYQVARQSLREENIAKAAVERREDLIRVLGYYADALEWYIDECKKIGIEGFYLCTQGGEMKFYEIPGFYDEIIRPMDLRVMNHAAEGSKLNILHICDWEGAYDDLTRYADYPGDIVNTPLALNGVPFSLEDAIALFKRPVLGGFNRKAEIRTEAPETIAEMATKVLENNPEGKIMIGADCTVSEAPHANIAAAIEAAHKGL